MRTMMALAALVTTPAARLHSIHSAPAHTKTLHLIRHAQGTHNVNNDYKSPTHFDAPLTPLGEKQCRLLSRKCSTELEVELIVSSPMTRALQTAKLCFEGVAQPEGSIPMVACEDWRETVNFLCDVRRQTDVLKSEFPHVDFNYLLHDEDHIWAKYEEEFGDHKAHVSHRESGDGAGLEKRARAAWKFVAERPEKSIAIVSHSAFFMHMFTPYLGDMEGVVSYADNDVQDLMTTSGFENCELRSVAFEIP